MENFKLNREGNLISNTHRECSNKMCNNIFEITSKTVTLCNSCNSKRVKTNDPIRKMWYRAKSRARIKQLEFNLDFTDIIIPQFCPILGIELIEFSGKSGGKNESPALDRIIPYKGYIKGNIRVISHLANMMKSCANNAQLINFAKWINKEFPGQV